MLPQVYTWLLTVWEEGGRGQAFTQLPFSALGINPFLPFFVSFSQRIFFICCLILLLWWEVKKVVSSQLAMQRGEDTCRDKNSYV